MGVKKLNEYKIKHPIVGFVGLESHTATKEGKIYNKHNKEVGYKCNKGQKHMQVCSVNPEGEKVKYMRSRIIASMFIPNIQNKTLVRHLNRNKANDHVNNLEWITRSELNVLSANKNNKLNKVIADEIRALYKAGETTHAKLAKQYKVSQTTISQIINNRLWEEYSSDRIIRDPLLNAIIVKKLREDYTTGEYTQVMLADKYGIKQGIVSKIVNNKIWA